MEEPHFDELLRRLVAAEVRFVLVGGLAVSAWGVVRGTRDVDIVPDPDPKNLEQLAQLAIELGGRVQMAEAMIGSPDSINALLLNGERAMIETELGSLDVVHGLDGVAPYEELRARAVIAQILGVEVSICSLEDLREMKRAAGRARDIADLEDLDSVDEEA